MFLEIFHQDYTLANNATDLNVILRPKFSSYLYEKAKGKKTAILLLTQSDKCFHLRKKIHISIKRNIGTVQGPRNTKKNK